MRVSRIALLLCLMWPLIAGAWEPDPKDKRQVKVAEELERFMANDKVRGYIEQSYGYAVLPNFYRVAAGFGANLGDGLVIEQNQLVGDVWTIQGTLGFTAGFQITTQIIIFRNREVMEIFQTGRFEFQGRTSAALVTVGGAIDPGFLPDVAIFSRTKGGLMVEAAAMISKYNYHSLE